MRYARMGLMLLILLLIGGCESEIVEGASSEVEVGAEAAAVPLAEESLEPAAVEEEPAAEEKAEEDGSFQGRYIEVVEVGAFGGGSDSEDMEMEEYTNCLTLKEVPGYSVEYSARMFYANGHSCELSGTAKLMDDHHYFDQVEEHPGGCAVEIFIEEEVIRIGDESGACQANFCGARAHLDGTTFRRESRDPEGPFPCEGF